MVKNLIVYIAQSLVDKPEEVQVAEVHTEDATVYELRVAKDEVGKIIGRQGRTAKAIRAVVTAASAKLEKRSLLEIIE